MKKFFTMFFTCLLLNSISAQTICNNVDFTEADSKITLPREIGEEIADGPFTIEIWINGINENLQENHPTFISNRDFFGNGVSVLMHDNWNNSDHKMLCVNFEDHNYLDVSCPVILDATCRHLAIVREENVVRYYLDGTFLYKKNLVSHFSWESPLPIVLGGDEKNSIVTDYNGSIDEIKFWKRTVSDSEISETVYRKKLENPVDLVAHYRFIDENPDVLLDESGNDYHGFFGSENEPNSKAVRTTSCCSPIVDIKELTQTDFTLYPSPGKNVLRLEMNELLILDFEFVTPLGQVVQRGEIDALETTFNTESLTAGMYYLKLITGSSSVVKPFVISY